MMKASDGAKVLQLVPVAEPRAGDHYGRSFYHAVLCVDDEEKETARADVLFLAVMDDGSIRPVGVVGLTNTKRMAGDGELGFLEDMGYPVLRFGGGSSGIRAGFTVD